MKTVEKIVDTIFSGIDDSLYDREEAIDLIEIYAKSKAGQHETIVMWRKPDEELPTDGQEALFVQGNDIIRGYFSKPRSFFGPSGYNVNGINGNHQIDKWVPVEELL